MSDLTPGKGKEVEEYATLEVQLKGFGHDPLTATLKLARGFWRLRLRGSNKLEWERSFSTRKEALHVFIDICSLKTVTLEALDQLGELS